MNKLKDYKMKKQIVVFEGKSFKFLPPKEHKYLKGIFSHCGRPIKKRSQTGMFDMYNIKPRDSSLL